MKTKAFFDGACGPINPGGQGSWGVVIYRREEIIYEQCGLVPTPREQTSNNVAEYVGYVHALTTLQRLGLHHEPCEVFGDSKLVIYQMKGRWSVRNGGFYLPFYEEAKLLTQAFSDLKLRLIPRGMNYRADLLSKKALQEAKR